MTLRSLFAALSWRDLLCAVVGCRRPPGTASHSYVHLCSRCQRYGFVEVKRPKAVKS